MRARQRGRASSVRDVLKRARNLAALRPACWFPGWDVARAAVLGLVILAGAGGARAQDATNPPCVLDKCVNAPAPRSEDGGTGASVPARLAPGAFAFYVLSLSWSPGFCDTGGAAKAGQQCAEGANLGFVVHGLWPQNPHGYPSNCDSGSRFVPRAVLDRIRGLYPEIGLAIHEWRQHGTCTGLSPTDYFDQVRRARDRVTIPDALRNPTEPQTLAPIEIERAFVQANPGLRTDTMGVTCRQGELEEVRICFTKDLRDFTSCPEISRAACRSRSVSVMPVR
jgi:ribonuclease T2